MVKVVNLSSGVRRQQVLGWLSIMWFTSTVRLIAGGDVALETISQVEVQCGKNLTLTCNATSKREMNVLSLSWLAKKEPVCQNGRRQTGLGVLCESSPAGTFHYSLSLTLINVMPHNEGKYLCKLRSNLGVADASTSVIVQDCLEGSGFSTNGSHAMCWFTGVYPNCAVHWFQGEVNLTDSADVQNEQDQYGRYNVSSVLHVKKEDSSLLYKCALWIPSARKYLSNHQLTIPRAAWSTGSMVRLQWMCVTVGIMMVKFMI